jgi:hypothetical protein
MARLFVSQTQIDKWTSEGKVQLNEDYMRVPALARTFRLVPGVYFTQLVDGRDTLGLLGKVKSLDQLSGLRAEHYGASVIVGEVGYECVEGFLGIPDDSNVIQGSGLLRLDR